MEGQQGASNAAKETSHRKPDIILKIRKDPSATAKRPFKCNVRFRNDLPEIPCDPKMLLPALNPQEISAFSLTSSEREMKRDVLFPPDLGIPINALDIERYSVPARDALRLDPADAALLDSSGEVALGARPGVAKGNARREGSSDVSWLMRTKYITNDFSGNARRAAGKAPKVEAPAEPDLMDRPAQIAAIEKSFEAATKPPKHPKNPNAVPLEVLPILPDEMVTDWNCVQATFDGEPGADVDALSKLGPEERARTTQASQLKSFVRRKDDGSVDRFVAWLLPTQPPPAASGAAAADGSIAIAASQLPGDYEWIREYDSQVRYDERNQTYLLRIAKDHVGYSDLNTKVVLRKRKRGAFGITGDEQDAFLQPEKFVLEMAEGVEQQQQYQQEAPVPAVAAAVAVEEAQPQEEQPMEVDDNATAAAMKNVFGSDDEDD